jgi:hypothetical protein
MTLNVVQNYCVNKKGTEVSNMGITASISLNSGALLSISHPTAYDSFQCPLSKIEITLVTSTSTTITFSDGSAICSTLSSCNQILLS